MRASALSLRVFIADCASLPSAEVGVPLMPSVKTAALYSLICSRSSSAERLGMYAKISGESLPACFAATCTSVSSTDQPLRIQRTTLSFAAGIVSSNTGEISRLMFDWP